MPEGDSGRLTGGDLEGARVEHAVESFPLPTATRPSLTAPWPVPMRCDIGLAIADIRAFPD